MRPSWLKRRAAARRIPFTLLAGSYRFTDVHLAEILHANEVSAAAPSSARPRRARRANGQHEDAPTLVAALRPRPAARRG